MKKHRIQEEIMIDQLPIIIIHINKNSHKSQQIDMKSKKIGLDKDLWLILKMKGL